MSHLDLSYLAIYNHSASLQSEQRQQRLRPSIILRELIVMCVEHSGVNNMKSNYLMRLEKQSTAEGG